MPAFGSGAKTELILPAPNTLSMGQQLAASAETESTHPTKWFVRSHEFNAATRIP